MSNRKIKWESVYAGHHLVTGHLVGHCLIIVIVVVGPNAAVEVVDVHE